MESLPHLIICPGTLRAQWLSEIKMIFRPKSVDILIYDHGDRLFWAPSGTFNSSKLALHNRIVIATQSVCISLERINHIFTHLPQTLFADMKVVHKAKQVKNQQPWEFPPQWKDPAGTLFGQRFLTVIIDEAHTGRNLGNQHFSMLRILKQGVVRLPLTATPLLTSPQASRVLS